MKFYIIQTTILISLLLISSYSRAQWIRGRITDSLNLAIPGVLVKGIDSKKNETLAISDVNGVFRIRCNDCKCLYINSIDCKPETIMVSDYNKFININAKRNIINTPVLIIKKGFRKFEIDSSSYHSTFVDTIPGSDPDCMDNCVDPFVYHSSFAEPAMGYKLFFLQLFEILKGATFDSNIVTICFTVKKDGEVILNTINGLSNVNLDNFKNGFIAIANWKPGNLDNRARQTEYSMKIEIN